MKKKCTNRNLVMVVLALAVAPAAWATDYTWDASGSAPLDDGGGTLDAGTFTDTMAALNLLSDSTLELGSGHLTFGNSTGYTWSGNLELTGTLGDTTLRFVPKVTGAQLARMSYYGKPVWSTPDGYIISLQGTIILVR